MLMLGSYEYLGLLGHPRLRQAAIETIQRFGTGHHGVRLLAGTTDVHRLLETRIAVLSIRYAIRQIPPMPTTPTVP